LPTLARTAAAFGLVRLTGLEPATSTSGAWRSLRAELQARTGESSKRESQAHEAGLPPPGDGAGGNEPAQELLKALATTRGQGDGHLPRQIPLQPQRRLDGSSGTGRGCGLARLTDSISAVESSVPNRLPQKRLKWGSTSSRA
jgi:hypothetical protein